MEEGMSGQAEQVATQTEDLTQEVLRNGATVQKAGTGQHNPVMRETGEAQEEAENCSLLDQIMRTFPCRKQDIRSYSALALAYIGDAVYDLIIRTVVVGKANRPANDLHRITVKYVSANAQSKIVQALQDSFTEEEYSVYRRGKNAKPHTMAKNASVADYLRATGFEAVLGYLYLTGNMERVLELVKKGIERAELLTMEERARYGI